MRFARFFSQFHCAFRVRMLRFLRSRCHWFCYTLLPHYLTTIARSQSQIRTAKKIQERKKTKNYIMWTTHLFITFTLRYEFITLRLLFFLLLGCFFFSFLYFTSCDSWCTVEQESRVVVLLAFSLPSFILFLLIMFLDIRNPFLLLPQAFECRAHGGTSILLLLLRPFGRFSYWCNISNCNCNCFSFLRAACDVRSHKSADTFLMMIKAVELVTERQNEDRKRDIIHPRWFRNSWVCTACRAVIMISNRNFQSENALRTRPPK